MPPEHVIQLAVRAAEAAEPSPAAERMSNLNLAFTVDESGVWAVLDDEAELDAGGEPQAIASKASSDAIAAARFIGIT